MSSVGEAVPLNSANLRLLYAWLDTIPLSRPKTNSIADDFSDGVMMAEVFAFYAPKLIDTSMYTAALDGDSKRSNWQLLNDNVFLTFEIRLSDYTIVQLADAKPGIIEQVLWEIRPKLLDFGQSTTDSSPAQAPDANTDYSFKELAGIKEISRDRQIWKALLAEFLGTLILVFVGCGSWFEWDKPSELDDVGKIKKEENARLNEPSVLQVSLAFGLILATMEQVVGHISDCHVNPAVTLAQLIAAKVKPLKAGLFIVFQCAGAIAGAALLKALTPNSNWNFGVTVPHQGVTEAMATGIEFIITLVLVLTDFAASDENRTDVKGSVPLAIGLSATACHLFAFTLTGASMNPARTLGPAVISGVWTSHWIYWAGPCAAGAVAGLLYSNIMRAPTSLVPAAGADDCDDPADKADAKEVA
jgi:MIP family channel proteins